VSGGADLDALHAALAAFNRARDWEQFHTPRDLAMALSVEASELLELFLWRGDPASSPPRERLAEELGDVMICLCNVARAVDVDLLDAAFAKLARNAEKYPVATARGRADKYDALPPHPQTEPPPDACE
jgi:dCTP diphosphatase